MADTPGAAEQGAHDEEAAPRPEQGPSATANAEVATPSRLSERCRRLLETVGVFVAGAVGVALGIFGPDGAVRFANRGMLRLLGGGEGQAMSLARLVSPTFAQLLARHGDGERVYHGLLHFTDMVTTAHSVRGEVHRFGGGLGDDLLIIAEFDVVELERVTAEVSALNSEIVGLQRQLLSERAALARTLPELRATQTQLVHAEKLGALGKFAAGMAHELNNPLAFVSSNFRTLSDALERLLGAYRRLEEGVERDGCAALKAAASRLREDAELKFLDEEGADLVRGSLGGLSRMREIIDSLRTFSRLEGAPARLADPKESIQSALAMAGPMLSQGDVRVSVELGDLPKVCCNPTELDQVFLNLLDNAVQAVEFRGRGEGWIHIRGRAEAGHVILEIEDNGTGIPAEYLDKIFDPFFTTKPVGRGMGLGLNIAYRIVAERCGGTIAVVSTPGAGSTFTIVLAKSEETSRAAPAG